MTRQTPQNDKFVSKFQEAGRCILDNAMDVFFKPDREVAEAKKAVEDLKDLEFAMKNCYENARNNQDDAIVAKQNEMNKPDYYKGDLSNAEIIPNGMDYYYYRDRNLGWSDQKIVSSAICKLDNTDDFRTESLKGISDFIGDLHDILPLYTCVAMVPGPMSLSVKNFAKEILVGTYKDKSISESSEQSRGLKGSLLLLGAAVNSSNSESYSRKDVEGNVSYNKMTTDERVMPALMDLRSRLDEMKIKETKDCNITVEYKLEGIAYLSNFLSKRSYKGQGTVYEKAPVKTMHMWLPETGKSSFVNR